MSSTKVVDKLWIMEPTTFGNLLMEPKNFFWVDLLQDTQTAEPVVDNNKADNSSKHRYSRSIFVYVELSVHLKTNSV